MKLRIITLNCLRKLRKTRKQQPNACIDMNEKSNTPMVNVDVTLLDLQEANIGVVRNVSRRDAGHKESKKRKCQQKCDT